MRHHALLSRLLISGIAFVMVQRLSNAHCFAFKKVHHSDLVRQAFRDVVSPDANQRLKTASIIGDEMQWENSAAHYDNCAWYEGRAFVQQHRLGATLATVRYASSGSKADGQAVFDSLGFVLHATQDFYAHSNWIETHPWGSLADLDGPRPKGWISGTFPDDEPKRCPKGSPTHDELNKDSSHRRGFEEARFNASLAISQQLELFRAEVRRAMAEQGDGDDVLARLGLVVSANQARIARTERAVSAYR